MFYVAIALLQPLESLLQLYKLLGSIISKSVTSAEISLSVIPCYNQISFLGQYILTDAMVHDEPRSLS